MLPTEYEADFIPVGNSRRLGCDSLRRIFRQYGIRWMSRDNSRGRNLCPVRTETTGKSKTSPNLESRKILMATQSNDVTIPRTSRAPRRANGRIPSGCKSISVIVPDKLYYHVQTQASLSCMSMPDYLFHFLQQAHSLSASPSIPNDGRTS